MKKSMKLICILLFAVLFANKVKAQAMSDSVAVILSPGTTDLKTIHDVKATLKTMTGVRFVGYCNNHNVYVAYIDRKVHGSLSEFCDNLKSATNVSSLNLKKGKAEAIISFCSFSDPDDAAAIKAQLDK